MPSASFRVNSLSGIEKAVDLFKHSLRQGWKVGGKCVPSFEKVIINIRNFPLFLTGRLVKWVDGAEYILAGAIAKEVLAPGINHPASRSVEFHNISSSFFLRRKKEQAFLNI